MIHHGLGIASDYVGTTSRLSGCIKDCNLWHSTFAPVVQGGYVLLQGRNATRLRVLDALRGIAKACPIGSDHSHLIHFSGHGTRNNSSNDPTEPDRKDDAICCDDFLQGGLIWDNELAEILAGSQGLVATDCCHSGTMLRTTVVDSPIDATPRFIPFDQICEGLLQCEVHKLCEGADKCRVAARSVRDASGAIPGVVHLAGCLDHEYSYDTAQGGAMTIAAINAYRALPVGANFQTWIDLIKTKLPTNQFPQNPVMTATDNDLRRVLPGKELPTPQPPSNVASTGEGILTLDGKTYDVIARKAN